MLPEQIPGTLFVLLVASVALATGNHAAVLILAVGCAFGWFTFSPDIGHRVKNSAALAALAIWGFALVLTIKGL